jgi:nucleotide-binding universal stress UspA family protein
MPYFEEERSMSAHRTGLIVMGAYTHGHYRQFLFGGMTRHVIEHAAIPILFN